MFTDDDCVRFFAPKLSKDLRALAIKSLAECDIRRDRLRPPVAFDAAIFSDVAHRSATVPIANSKRARETDALLRRKFSRCIKFCIHAAAGQKFRTEALLDDASVI